MPETLIILSFGSVKPQTLGGLQWLAEAAPQPLSWKEALAAHDALNEALGTVLTRFCKLTLALVAFLWLLTSCSSTKSAAASAHGNENKPQSERHEQNSGFLPPTAVEAYRLQDDCFRRGEQIVSENHIGTADTHKQVSRYNPVTNRCYITLEVGHSLDSWHDQIYDGQTKELLASCEKTQEMEYKTYMCFAYSMDTVIEEEIGNCLSGKRCELRSNSFSVTGDHPRFTPGQQSSLQKAF